MVGSASSHQTVDLRPKPGSTRRVFPAADTRCPPAAGKNLGLCFRLILGGDLFGILQHPTDHIDIHLGHNLLGHAESHKASTLLLDALTLRLAVFFGPDQIFVAEDARRHNGHHPQYVPWRPRRAVERRSMTNRINTIARHFVSSSAIAGCGQCPGRTSIL